MGLQYMKEEDIEVKEKEEKLIMHAYSVTTILIMSPHLLLIPTAQDRNDQSHFIAKAQRGRESGQVHITSK